MFLVEEEFHVSSFLYGIYLLINAHFAEIFITPHSIKTGGGMANTGIRSIFTRLYDMRGDLHLSIVNYS